MLDQAHRETDKELEKMERKLRTVYGQAAVKSQLKLGKFLDKFQELDRIKQRQVKEGKLDAKTYLTWRRNKMAMGENYRAMVDTLTSDMVNTNQIAASVINGHLPEVYANNYNFGTYQIEHDSQINTSFTLYDRQTVERLMRDSPDVIPIKARVDIPKDKLWNKRKINDVITQSILTGDSIPDIAKSLAKVAEMNKVASVRTARTATTSAENGGRIDSYKRAQEMGIKLRQQWLATLDGRTRDSHRALDGEIIAVAKDKWHPAKFSNGCRFPGDPQGPGYEIYNCRCTLLGVVDGVDFELSDVTKRDSKLGSQSYDEWKAGHKKKPVKPVETKPTPKPTPKKEPERKLVGDIRDKLGDGFVDAMETMLHFAEGKEAENVASVYYKFGNKLKVIDAETRDTACFNPLDGGVHINIAEIRQGDGVHAPYQTAFHEFMHNIDFIASGGLGNGWFSQKYKDGLLEKTIAEDFNNYIKHQLLTRGDKIASRFETVQILKQMDRDNVKGLRTVAKKLDDWIIGMDEVWSKHGEELAEHIMNTPMWKSASRLWVSMDLKKENMPDIVMGSLSDAIEGQGAPSLGVGHGGKYWRKVVSTDVDPSGYQSTHNQPLEFLAEYADGTIANPKSLEQMRRVFPKSCDVCAEITEELLKL